MTPVLDGLWAVLALVLTYALAALGLVLGLALGLALVIAVLHVLNVIDIEEDRDDA